MLYKKYNYAPKRNFILGSILSKNPKLKEDDIIDVLNALEELVIDNLNTKGKLRINNFLKFERHVMNGKTIKDVNSKQDREIQKRYVFKVRLLDNTKQQLKKEIEE